MLKAPPQPPPKSPQRAFPAPSASFAAVSPALHALPAARAQNQKAKPQKASARDWSPGLVDFLLNCAAPPAVVTRGRLQRAILTVFQDAACDPASTGMVGLSHPCWTGWMSSQMILWRLPVSLAECPYALAPPKSRDSEAGCFVAETCLELAAAGELQKRLTCPLKHNEDPEVAARQDWEFRLPSFGGCCYWEPSRPESLTREDDWLDLVNARHRVLLLDNLGGDRGDVPLYVLARIERYRRQNTGRATPRRVLLF